jgi:NADH dehydrogenase
MTENTDVVVIGGGYAGVYAANRLTQRDDVTMTLINPRPTFVERIRLHQLVGGSYDAAVDYRKILADGIRLVVDTVTRIDAAERSVTLASGGTVGYDYLIYAVGSGSARPSVPGAAEFAYPMSTLEDAERLRSVVDAGRHDPRSDRGEWTSCGADTDQGASRGCPHAGSGGGFHPGDTQRRQP